MRHINRFRLAPIVLEAVTAVLGQIRMLAVTNTSNKILAQYSSALWNLKTVEALVEP